MLEVWSQARIWMLSTILSQPGTSVSCTLPQLLLAVTKTASTQYLRVRV